MAWWLLCVQQPLVVLEPTFTGWDVATALIGPLVTSTFAKDVLEPWLLGAATSLHPVVMLLSIMLFGTIWGMVGMVMVSTDACAEPHGPVRWVLRRQCQ